MSQSAIQILILLIVAHNMIADIYHCRRSQFKLMTNNQACVLVILTQAAWLLLLCAAGTFSQLGFNR